MHFPLLALLFFFLGSLALAMLASSWFTTRLEIICALFDLPDNLLSLLGALGANIPNYAASIVAISSGRLLTGLGIIVGSNIYNIAIILAVSTFAGGRCEGIVLSMKAMHDARIVALYTCGIMLTTLLAILTLSTRFQLLLAFTPGLSMGIVIVINLLSLGLFAGLSRHSLHRTSHEEPGSLDDETTLNTSKQTTRGRARPIMEAIFALVIALAAVILMEQSGQAVALEIHLSPVIFGLVILAIATSLPNTVVAFILARTGRATASVEEVFSSNSINAALGIALPLLFWRDVLTDRFLLLLDTPLMLLLTLVGLWLVQRRRISHFVAVILLLVYVAWLVIHLLL